jgi:hypothetical protein
MGDPFGLIEVNLRTHFSDLQNLVFLLSSAGFVPSSNIRVTSSISLFYFFLSSFLSSCCLLLFNRFLIKAVSLFVCLLTLVLFLQLTAPPSPSLCQFVSVMDKKEQGQASLSEYFGFPLSVSLHHCYILIHPSPMLYKTPLKI